MAMMNPRSGQMGRIKNPKDFWSNNLTRGGRFPDALFMNGEQGAHYEVVTPFQNVLNPMMWQDAAGTTLVSAVEQPVGKWRDLSGRNNHATQGTATARPVLSARYNQLVSTEDITAVNWTKPAGGVAKNAASAPDGTLTAAIANFNVGGGAEQLFQSVSSGTTNSLTQEVWLRCATGPVNFTYGFFDNGASFTDNISVTSTWQKFTKTNAAGFAGVGADRRAMWLFPAVACTLEFWHPDMRYTSDLSINQATYQRVNTASDYDTSNYIHYLNYDGVDDFMSSPAVDGSSYFDIEVWAGVTKIDDTLQEFIVGQGIGVGAPGTWDFFSAGTGRWSMRYWGSSLSSQNTYPETTNSISRVLKATYRNDLATGAAASLALRESGSAIAASSSVLTAVLPQAAANLALNVGGTAIQRYKGRITSLTVRLSNQIATQDQLVGMEQYAAAKAGLIFTSN